jgi:SAM-dependent methyltransferase
MIKYYYANMMKKYPAKFYDEQAEGSKRSAEEIVPLVLELLEPESVVDVGCGTGAWLSVFAEAGIKDILGIDGDWVDKEALLIPEKNFLAADLLQPIKLAKKFDLAISLEVAEHLPAESAETFVASIVGLAPIVLFSAAAPFQGGTNHLNEQWPEYWAQLFRQHNYLAVDCLRKKIWDNEKVEPWYAQNILLFAPMKIISDNKELSKYFLTTKQDELSLIHPKIYLPK